MYRPTLLPNAFFSLKSWGMSPVPQVVCVAYLDIGFLNWEGPDPDATKTILFFIGKPNCHETILFRSCHFHPPGLAVLEIELFQTIRQTTNLPGNSRQFVWSKHQNGASSYPFHPFQASSQKLTTTLRLAGEALYLHRARNSTTSGSLTTSSLTTSVSKKS